MSDRPVILITGTSKGIGKYLSHYYASYGYDVIGCSRGKIDFKIENYRHFYLDISDENQLKEMFKAVKIEYGRLDALINNAGLTSTNYAMLLNADHIKSVYATNVIGTMLASREAIKIMKKKVWANTEYFEHSCSAYDSWDNSL